MVTYVVIRNCGSKICCAILVFVLGSTVSIPKAGAAESEAPKPVAYWAFEEGSSSKARDSVSGIDDQIVGLAQRTAGAKGMGLRFDGYTTAVIRSAKPKVVSDTRAAG